jgi:hypothetical protein
VAYEAGGELRISGWNSRNRLRAGSKHLCGQICLHKLADDFMARTISMRGEQRSGEEAEPEPVAATDTSLTAVATGDECESSARLLTPAEAAAARAGLRPAAELVTMPERSGGDRFSAPSAEPRHSTLNWRAEAWERERERELRAAERRGDVMARRGR